MIQSHNKEIMNNETTKMYTQEELDTARQEGYDNGYNHGWDIGFDSGKERD